MIKFKVLLFLVLMVSDPIHCQDAQEKVEEGPDLASNTNEEIGSAPDIMIAKLLKTILQKYEGLHVPALPTISYNKGNISVSLSLADLVLKGHLDLGVSDTEVLTNGIKTSLLFKKVYLDVGRYSSGGYLLNLPFAGEGPLLIAIHKLSISIELSNSGGLENGGFCVKENLALPITLHLDQRRLEVKFSNMNPGGDQGQLINIVLSSFGPDIIDYLNILLNGKDREVAHRIVLDVVNTALCPGWVSNNPLDNKEEMTEYMSTIFRHFVEALKVPDQGFGIW